MRDQLAQEYPDYAGFLEDAFDEVAGPARRFLARLLELTPDMVAAAGGFLLTGVEQTLFEEIGRQHRQQGKDIVRLLAVYRIGAATAWRWLTQPPMDPDISPHLVGLADALFTVVDQLSSISLRGYLVEPAVPSGMRDRHRADLARLLLSSKADLPRLREAADLAGWPIPRNAAVILVPTPQPQAQLRLALLDPNCLQLAEPHSLTAILPDPSGPGRPARIAERLRGTGAVVGMSVPPRRLSTSLRIAELGARVRQARHLTDDPLFVEKHLDTIIVHRDEELTTELRRRSLAPLAPLPSLTRERLIATLRAWLRHMGDRHAMAAELFVHPQTVRYRIAQLRELFGAELDDPACRARLLLAIGWVRPDSARPGRRDGKPRTEDFGGILE